MSSTDIHCLSVLEADVQDQGIRKVGGFPQRAMREAPVPGLSPQLRGDHLHPVSLHMAFSLSTCLQVSPFDKGTSHIG